ncbi:MAG: PhoU domain-containing protein [Acidimicrobiia bacterium]|nr:PhoU domain-containing protein [Acidimicrobiia bacterium]
MVLEFFRRGSESQLEQTESKIGQMLSDARHSFDLASNALLAGADPAVVGADVHTTDKRINATERDIRRDLVVHVSVHSSGTDVPMVLAYMAVAKDVERIGDYAKNIFDLATQGIDFSGAADIDQLSSYRQRVSLLIAETAQTFLDRATEEARTYLFEGDILLKEYDEKIDEFVTSTEPSNHGVPRALYFRYLKRITAHLMNVLTSLTMPVDRLAYFDETEEDRLPLDE